MKTLLITAALIGLAACNTSLSATTQNADTRSRPHANAGPAVYIVNLHDGDTVTAPFRVVFGLYGYGIAPAGVDKPKTGHHHLLIDTELSAEERAYAIPSDDQHRHFGKGQTETVVDLPAGDHTLQLMLGNYQHIPLKDVAPSKPITIHVK